MTELFLNLKFFKNIVKKLDNVEKRHKEKKNSHSLPTFEAKKNPWVSKCATLMAHIKNKNKIGFRAYF